jgi:hypothetical protein
MCIFMLTTLRDDGMKRARSGNVTGARRGSANPVRILTSNPASLLRVGSLGTEFSKDRRRECYNPAMSRSLRALASLTVGIMTVVGMLAYQHYSREPPTGTFTAAVTTAASVLAWLVTGLE